MSWILLSSMNHIHDFYCINTYAINHNIIRMNNSFPRAINTTSAVKIGVFGQALGTSFDSGQQAISCLHITLSYKRQYRFEI